MFSIGFIICGICPPTGDKSHIYRYFGYKIKFTQERGDMDKGKYGYRTFYKKKMGIIIALFIIAILAQYIASKVVSNKALGNILIVMSILTVLPMANLLSPYIVAFKYKTPPKEEYEKIKKFEDRGIMLYDLTLTTKDKVIGADYCLIRENDIFLYSPITKDKTEKKALEKNLNSKIKINVYYDISTFIRELEKLKVSDYKNTVVRDLIKSMSI